MSTSERGDPVAGTAQDASRATASRGPAPGRRPAARSLVRLSGRFSILVVWAALIVVYSLTEPRLFPRAGTYETIFGSQQPLVFMTMALMCTIVVGEFVDLSVPSVFGFSATVLPVLVVFHGWGVWPAALVAVLAATAIGLVQGILVVRLGVNPIVVTLGMSTLLQGLSLWVSNMSTVSGLPSSFASIATRDVGGLPVDFYYGVALVLVFAWILWATPLGRHMRFVGASREVSRLSGVRVDRIRLGAFVFAGLLSGIGAVIAAAAVGGWDATTANSYLLPTFAAVFLSTAILEPGRFNPLGTLLGIYFLATGILGLQLLGLQAWVSQVFYGGILVVAVTISTLLHRRGS